MPPRVIESLQDLQALAGEEIGASDWMLITQERVNAFAETTEDRQWIHIDAERAERESPFRKTIAHGFLTLSLISHLMKQAVEIRGLRMAINYGLNRVRFTSPVVVGARIRARFTVQQCKEIAGGFEVIYVATVESESSNSAAAAKPCCVAEWVLRYYS
jgi:acyl dehydratase